MTRPSQQRIGYRHVITFRHEGESNSDLQIARCPRRVSPRRLTCRPAGIRLRESGRSGTTYFWNGARILSISACARFIPSSGVYFSSRISWKVVVKMFRIFQLSCVLISGEA